MEIAKVAAWGLDDPGLVRAGVVAKQMSVSLSGLVKMEKDRTDFFVAAQLMVSLSCFLEGSVRFRLTYCNLTDAILEVGKMLRARGGVG